VKSAQWNSGFTESASHLLELILKLVPLGKSIYGNTPPAASASEATSVRRFSNMSIITISISSHRLTADNLEQSSTPVHQGSDRHQDRTRQVVARRCIREVIDIRTEQDKSLNCDEASDQLPHIHDYLLSTTATPGGQSLQQRHVNNELDKGCILMNLYNLSNTKLEKDREQVSGSE